MIANLGLQIGLYLIALVAIVKPLGSWMSRVFQGHPTGLDRVLKPIECGLYRLAGVHPDDEMTWKTYCTSLLLLNGLGIVVVYLLLRWQPALPLNPQGFGASSPDLAFNTAVSFITNTNCAKAFIIARLYNTINIFTVIRHGIKNSKLFFNLFFFLSPSLYLLRWCLLLLIDFNSSLSFVFVSSLKSLITTAQTIQASVSCINRRAFLFVCLFVCLCLILII